jgi:hypothetical protein
MNRFSRKYLGISVAIFVTFVFLFFIYRIFFSWQFAQSYKTYATLSSLHIRATLLPAMGENPVRQELNRMLADVLAAELPREDRLQRAQRGLLLLSELEKQIDAIGDSGEAVSKALGELEDRASGSERNEIVNLALERIRIIGDIRGLSYRASYHTAEIFNRVIQDGGTLTPEHVTELNSQIPLVEEQFDRRTGLYDELESIGGEIEKVHDGLSIF